MTVMAPLIDVTLRGLLGRRRTLLLVLLVGLPVLISLLIRISGGQPNADRVLDTLVVRTVMPLVALIVGTAAIGSEIEDGTAVYLMIKPIPRWKIALSKGLVAAGLTAALVVPAVVLTGFLLGGTGRTRRRRSSVSRSPAWSVAARMPWRSWRSASSPRVRSCSVWPTR